MNKEEQKKLLTEIMEADEKDGLYKTNNMATRVKVTYVAILEGRPIVSASTLEDLRKGLDDYYGVDKKYAECLGFVPNYSKYPDEYEGYYSYQYTFRDDTLLDVIKVYCIDYYPHTIL